MGRFKHEVTERIELAKALLAEGLSYAEIARKFEVTPQCIQQELARAEQRGKYRTDEQILELHSKILELRARKLIVKDIAYILGISISYVNKILYGTRGPKP